MLEAVVTSSETSRHYCNGLKRSWVESQAPVFIHDVQAYVLIPAIENGGVSFQNIKYCPYCGVIVDNDR